MNNVINKIRTYIIILSYIIFKQDFKSFTFAILMTFICLLHVYMFIFMSV